MGKVLNYINKLLTNGSGTSIQEVNKLIKQFDGIRKMMRMVQTNGNKFPKLK